MTLRHRSNEAMKLVNLYLTKIIGLKPKPKLLDSIYQREDLSRPTLLDGEPVFDVNVIKHNNDLLYLVSNTDNKTGVNG